MRGGSGAKKPRRGARGGGQGDPDGTLKKAEPQERIADRSHDRTRDAEEIPRSAGRGRRKTDRSQAQGGSGEPMSRYFSSREDSVADGNFTRGTATLRATAAGRPGPLKSLEGRFVVVARRRIAR
jgi:hypothetical protein